MNYLELIKLPYQEFLVAVLREAPKNCTWRVVSRWLEKQYTIEQISAMYVKLHTELVKLTPDDKDEDPAADVLRDNMDVFYYAGNKEIIQKLIKENSMT